MIMRHTMLWKKINALLLRRLAVRVLWIGPETPVDPRIEDAKKRGQAQPMPPELMSAIKEVIDLVPRKQELWSAIKAEADAQMSKLWTKIWATPRGKEYAATKEELDRRRKRVDAEGRKLEDGIWTKLVAGGQLLTYVKTHVLSTSEEQIRTATEAVEMAKAQLQEAKTRLKELQRSKADAVERVNVLLIENVKVPPKLSRLVPVGWSAAADRVEQALMNASSVDDLMLEPLDQMNAALDGLINALEDLAAQEATEEDFAQVEPCPVPPIGTQCNPTNTDPPGLSVF